LHSNSYSTYDDFLFVATQVCLPLCHWTILGFHTMLSLYNLLRPSLRLRFALFVYWAIFCPLKISICDALWVLISVLLLNLFCLIIHNFLQENKATKLLSYKQWHASGHLVSLVLDLPLYILLIVFYYNEANIYCWNQNEVHKHISNRFFLPPDEYCVLSICY
jgi:hypothetical protein